MESPKIEARKILEFLHVAENLKKLIRHSWLSDGRRESVAEHTWRMSLMSIGGTSLRHSC
jgi:putative hydrolase of HD superfamily